MDFIAKGGRNIVGEIEVSADKSMSHRSIMLASLAEGESVIENFLEGEDSLATLDCFVKMGIQIERPAQGTLIVQGKGMKGLSTPKEDLYVGNSGTSIRLLSGILAAQQFSSCLDGDSSIRKRPMARVIAPLSIMGAVIKGREGNLAPLDIEGKKNLNGIEYASPVVSAQVKSSILLAGLYAQGETAVTETAVTRNHTESMLQYFGYPVHVEGLRSSVTGGGSLKAREFSVPGDISSAAFFIVAALITPGSDLLIKRVGVNPTRTGVIEILKLMGGKIECHPYEIAGEKVADIRVQYSSLKGIEIPKHTISLAIDEFPIIFIAASVAEGETILTGAEELRVKESDRIAAMAQGLSACNVECTVLDDGIVIQGQEYIQGGCTLNSCADHRVAMSFAVASLVARENIRIKNCQNVMTSFPNFITLANSIGLNIDELKE